MKKFDELSSKEKAEFYRRVDCTIRKWAKLISAKNKEWQVNHQREKVNEC